MRGLIAGTFLSGNKNIKIGEEQKNVKTAALFQNLSMCWTDNTRGDYIYILRIR